MHNKSCTNCPIFVQEVSQNWCGRLYAFFQQRAWAKFTEMGAKPETLLIGRYSLKIEDINKQSTWVVYWMDILDNIEFWVVPTWKWSLEATWCYCKMFCSFHFILRKYLQMLFVECTYDVAEWIHFNDSEDDLKTCCLLCQDQTLRQCNLAQKEPPWIYYVSQYHCNYYANVCIYIYV